VGSNFKERAICAGKGKTGEGRKGKENGDEFTREGAKQMEETQERGQDGAGWRRRGPRQRASLDVWTIDAVYDIQFRH